MHPHHRGAIYPFDKDEKSKMKKVHAISPRHVPRGNAAASIHWLERAPCRVAAKWYQEKGL
jgi:hypothetical protein